MLKQISRKLRNSPASNTSTKSQVNSNSCQIDPTDDVESVWNSVSPTRKGLTKLVLKARRCGAWFRRLKKDERNYVELVIMVVEKIQSSVIKMIVARILRKLLVAMKSVEIDLAHIMKKIGLPLAHNISVIAQTWGNNSASRWSRDTNFIRYLTIMYLNKSMPIV